MEINEIRYCNLKHDLGEARKGVQYFIRKCDSIEKKIAEMRFKIIEIDKAMAEHEQKILDCVNLKGGEDVR